MRREQGSEQTVMRELSAQHLSRFDLAEGHDSPWTKHSSCLGPALLYHFLRYASCLHLVPGHLQTRSLSAQLSLPCLASIILCDH